MTIGVAVEGPSDVDFWDKVLHKHFPGVKFKFRNLNGRDKLIRATPQLVETFKDARYSAGFILIDRDEKPCITSVLQEFDDRVRSEAEKPLDERFVFICVAVRELEAWFLADAPAINLVLPKASHSPPSETGDLNALKVLKKLWGNHHQTAFNKREFAKEIAPKFNPEEARRHSASFDYFWEAMRRKASFDLPGYEKQG